MVILDLEQLHAIEVDDQVQTRHRVGVRARTGVLAVPDVRPSQPASRVLLGEQVRAIRPGVDEHEIHVGDPAAAHRLDHARIAPQRRIALVVLVVGHVRLAVGLQPPAHDAILGQRHESLIDGPAVAVPAHDARGAVDRISAGVLAHRALDGSRNSIEANRHPSPTSRSRRTVATAARISSAVSGSRGWRLMRGDPPPSQSRLQPQLTIRPGFSGSVIAGALQRAARRTLVKDRRRSQRRPVRVS